MPSRRLHLPLLVVAIAIALALPAGCASGSEAVAAPAPPPRTFFGVHGATSHENLAKVREAGIGTVAVSFYWGGVEQRRGSRDWTNYDRIVADAARSGAVVQVRLEGSAGYLNRAHTSPPTSAGTRAAFAAFARDAVARYGHEGDFWRLHGAGTPDPLPYRPAVSWQVWNEPNLPAWWRRKPSPRQYAALLRAAAPAIKAADPKARVVLGGLPDSRLGVPAATYLDRLYRASPGIASSFDTVAIHPYAKDARALRAAIARVRGVLTRHRDRSARILLTEMGWATGSGFKKTPWTTSRGGQAIRLRQAFEMLVTERRRLGIEGAIWFTWRDQDPREGRWWGGNCGLFTAANRAKPSWTALRRLTQALPREDDPAPLDPYAGVDPYAPSAGGTSG